MRSGFKKKHAVSLTLILGMLIIAVLLTSCGKNTNGDSEASDSKNIQSGETNIETPTSSATSGAEDVGSGEHTESNSTETTESNSTEEPYLDNNVYIIVESSIAKPGDKNVEINVLFKNNPGIFGMDFDVYYDDSVLTLVDAVSFVNTDSCVFTQPKKYHTPSTFLWDFQDEVWDKDGMFLKLVFNISETAQSGDYTIEIKYSMGNIFDKDFNPIIINANDGMLKIIN